MTSVHKHLKTHTHTATTITCQSTIHMHLKTFKDMRLKDTLCLGPKDTFNRILRAHLLQKTLTLGRDDHPIFSSLIRLMIFCKLSLPCCHKYLSMTFCMSSAVMVGSAMGFDEIFALDAIALKRRCFATETTILGLTKTNMPILHLTNRNCYPHRYHAEDILKTSRRIHHKTASRLSRINTT